MLCGREEGWSDEVMVRQLLDTVAQRHDCTSPWRVFIHLARAIASRYALQIVLISNIYRLSSDVFALRFI